MPKQQSSGFDAIVGNPPFLNQLERRTVSDRRIDALIRHRLGPSITAYTDLSAAMLLLAVGITRGGGRVAFVQPQSFLASRDAGPIRSEVLRRASLLALWIADGPAFQGTDILTCAPTLCVNGPRRCTLTTSVSLRFEAQRPIHIDNDDLAQQETWAPLAAAARGVPAVAISGTRTIGDCASATADFRDQYYGLDGFLCETEDLDAGDAENWSAYPPIVTSGLIEPALCRWSEVSTSIHKRRWLSPRVDRGAMVERGELGQWITSRLVPKLILATQTRVTEVFVDESGRYLPGLPLISVVPKEPDLLWPIAAVLASPVVTALALTRYAGTAMSVDSIKLAARQVLTMPMPESGSELARASACFRMASSQRRPEDRLACLVDSAEAACRAFGVSGVDQQKLMQWWSARLRRNRSLRSAR